MLAPEERNLFVSIYNFRQVNQQLRRVDEHHGCCTLYFCHRNLQRKVSYRNHTMRGSRNAKCEWPSWLHSTLITTVLMTWATDFLPTILPQLLVHIFTSETTRCRGSRLSLDLRHFIFSATRQSLSVVPTTFNQSLRLVPWMRTVSWELTTRVDPRTLPMVGWRAHKEDLFLSPLTLISGICSLMHLGTILQPMLWPINHFRLECISARWRPRPRRPQRLLRMDLAGSRSRRLRRPRRRCPNLSFRLAVLILAPVVLLIDKDVL